MVYPSLTYTCHLIIHQYLPDSSAPTTVLLIPWLPPTRSCLLQKHCPTSALHEFPTSAWHSTTLLSDLHQVIILREVLHLPE